MTHVNRSSGRNFPLALVCLMIFVASACGQAPPSTAETTYTPRADPLYQQCASPDGTPANKGRSGAAAALKVPTPPRESKPSKNWRAADRQARAAPRRSKEIKISPCASRRLPRSDNSATANDRSVD